MNPTNIKDKPYLSPAERDETCTPPVRSRQVLSGPQIAYLTITGGAVATGDIPLNLPFPCNAFFIASVKTGQENSTIAFHLAKLQKTYAGVALTALGTEPWIPMTAPPAGGPVYRTVIRFKEPIFPQAFVDLGAEGGANTVLTIGVVRDDNFLLSGGIY